MPKIAGRQVETAGRQAKIQRLRSRNRQPPSRKPPSAKTKTDRPPSRKPPSAKPKIAGRQVENRRPLSGNHRAPSRKWPQHLYGSQASFWQLSETAAGGPQRPKRSHKSAVRGGKDARGGQTGRRGRWKRPRSKICNMLLHHVTVWVLLSSVKHNFWNLCTFVF